uniref:DNA (cytosine-5-)-methyltransferase n=1 Tax=viral metagenome TaxID=1070528 RepID=A0A6C0AU08_9ZZZZ|tara:strand:+ start:791 stop:2002 length:1212 start_codon:yes stop_codon:yes gene_type:complete
MSSNTSTAQKQKKKTIKKTTKKTTTTEKSSFTPSCMSLFSGLGGDSLGMQNAGGKMVAYNEINPLFCDSHDLNFPHCKRIEHEGTLDITKIPDSTFLQYANSIDILFAGFPCQGFSHAGKKMDNDPRNTLFREFLRVTQLIKPSLIIGENVKGLLSRKTTSGEPYIDVIVSEFQKLGYSVQYKVLRADDYGVPQKRERLIILGTLPNPDKQIDWKPSFPEPTLDNPNLRNIVKYDMSNTLKVDDALFDGIPDECILINMDDNQTYQDNNDAHPYLVSKVFATGDNLSYGGKTHEHLFSFGKRISPIHCEIVDIRQCCKTVICSYDHQPRFFVPIRNPSGSFLRVLLPDELKQIQGFPANYKMLGNWKQKVTQIGNAVPPPLVQHVVQNILNPPNPTDSNTKDA